MSMFTDSSRKLKPLWAFVFSLILSALAFVVSGNIAYEASDQHPFRQEFYFRALWTLLLVGIFFWLLTVGDHIEEHRLAAQGLPRTKGWLKHFVIGAFIGFILTVAAVAPIHFWGHFRTQNMMTVHLIPNLGAVLLMLLFGSLAEELVFRGYPFQHLEQGIGGGWAIVVFSALYGILHLINPGAGVWGIANTILIGILLSIAYLRTRALWLPWGIHFGWNTTLGLLFGLPVSGFRFFTLIRYTDAYGPKWVTGGHYGVEASVPAMITILIGILIVATLPLRKLARPASQLSKEPALHNSLTGIQP